MKFVHPILLKPFVSFKRKFLRINSIKMTIKKLFFIFLLFVSFTIKAQVGIGTASPYAQLDVVSSNQTTPANTDGILIPKIDTFPASNPTALQQGMLVYLTTTATFASVSRSRGFYYWDNFSTNWIGIQTNPTSNWNIVGNATTSPATNFLGTTDDKDLVFRRNNSRSGYIGDPYYDPSTFNYNNGNTSFGANSMLNPSVNIATQAGVRNTGFGVNVMPSLSSGYNNIGIGDFALFSNTSGFLNIGIGSGALFTNSTANNNVAIGRNTLTTSNGNFNTAIGNAALRQNSVGNNNTAFGFESLRNVLGTGNVGLGYQAGRLETGSNRLYIANSNADAVNALIYGEFDTKILRVNGTLQIGDPTTTGYIMPVTRGTLGQVLQTNSTGVVTWQTPVNSYSVMRSNLSANQTVSSTGWQKINFNSSLFDTNSEFSTATSRFTAIRAGYYEINAGFHSFNKSDSEYYGISVYKNGLEYQETSSHHYGDKLISRTINCVISLVPGDYLEIYIFNGNAPTTIDGYAGKTYFEVKQIK